jgi:hypothetical protein
MGIRHNAQGLLMIFFSSLRALCQIGIHHSARGLLIAFKKLVL